MFFVVILLFGMVSVCNAMERIGSNQVTEYYDPEGYSPVFGSATITENGKTVVYYPTPIPTIIHPSAPCDRCMNSESKNDERVKILKQWALLPKNFTSSDDFEKALEEQDAKKNREGILMHWGKLDRLNIVKADSGLKNIIDKLYQMHMEKERPSLRLFADDCAEALAKPEYHTQPLQPESKPWTGPENVNNGFKLIRFAYKKLITIGIVSWILPILLGPLVAVDVKRTIIPAYYFYTMFLAHEYEKQCACHKRPNHTSECAYRLIYFWIGIASFVASFTPIIPWLVYRCIPSLVLLVKTLVILNV